MRFDFTILRLREQFNRVMVILVQFSMEVSELTLKRQEII